LDASCFFRVTDKTPELWDAATGSFDMVPFSTSDSGLHVPLHFDPLGSVFIVFREPVSEKTKTFVSSAEKLSFIEKPVENSWTVIFPGYQETQGKVLFKELPDWTENEDADIKYFSGTAEYRTVFKIKDIKSKRVNIDLGEVKNIAEVYVNDIYMGNLWKPPFLVDISKAVRKGKNSLVIKVTNTSVNRMIGDEQFPPDVHYESFPGPVTELPDWLGSPEKRKSGRKTFVTYSYYDKDSPLEPSGLLGPVKLRIMDVPD
jgi:hypothetical protein